MDKPKSDNDTVLLRQLVRQLKIINIWLSIFGSLILLTLGVLLVLLFQVVGAVRDAGQRIDTVRENVDVQARACEAEGGFGNFLRGNTTWCE